MDYMKNQILKICFIVFINIISSAYAYDKKDIELTKEEFKVFVFFGKIETFIDGDSFILADRKVKLWGIEAPQLNQKCYFNNSYFNCGKKSKQFLIEKFSNKTIACDVQLILKNNTYVSNCYAYNPRSTENFRTDGIFINDYLVAKGYAFEKIKISHGYFSKSNFEAQRTKKGLWFFNIVMPWKIMTQN